MKECEHIETIEQRLNKGNVALAAECTRDTVKAGASPLIILKEG